MTHAFMKIDYHSSPPPCHSFTDANCQTDHITSMLSTLSNYVVLQHHNTHRHQLPHKSQHTHHAFNSLTSCGSLPHYSFTTPAATQLNHTYVFNPLTSHWITCSYMPLTLSHHVDLHNIIHSLHQLPYNSIIPVFLTPSHHTGSFVATKVTTLQL